MFGLLGSALLCFTDLSQGAAFDLSSAVYTELNTLLFLAAFQQAACEDAGEDPAQLKAANKVIPQAILDACVGMAKAVQLQQGQEGAEFGQQGAVFAGLAGPALLPGGTWRRL